MPLSDVLPVCIIKTKFKTIKWNNSYLESQHCIASRAFCSCMEVLHVSSRVGQDLTNAVTTKLAWWFPPWAQSLTQEDLDLILHGKGWQNIGSLSDNLFIPAYVAVYNKSRTENVLANASLPAKQNCVTISRIWAWLSSASRLQDRWGASQYLEK